MPLFALVIKAPNVGLAAAYVQGRGLQVEGTPKLTSAEMLNVMIFARGPWENVSRWFIEPAKVNRGRGFPLGTLILYREVEPNEVRPTRKPPIHHDIEAPDLR